MTQTRAKSPTYELGETKRREAQLTKTRILLGLLGQTKIKQGALNGKTSQKTHRPKTQGLLVRDSLIYEPNCSCTIVTISPS